MTMANTTSTMKNKNEDRPFGNNPSGTGAKQHDSGQLADKAREAADKAKDTASNVADKARDLASTVGEKARDTMSNVGQRASEVASNVQQKAGEFAGNVQQKAGEFAGNVQHKACDIASQVGHKAEDATAAVAGGMKSLAESIREHSPEGGMFKSASMSVADTLESGSRYIQEEGLSGISGDVVSLIRRNPLPALFAGIAFGFLIARATSSRS